MSGGYKVVEVGVLVGLVGEEKGEDLAFEEHVLGEDDVRGEQGRADKGTDVHVVPQLPIVKPTHTNLPLQHVRLYSHFHRVQLLDPREVVYEHALLPIVVYFMLRPRIL